MPSSSHMDVSYACPANTTPVLKPLMVVAKGVPRHGEEDTCAGTIYTETDDLARATCARLCRVVGTQFAPSALGDGTPSS
jgi:hypothetical protein